MRSRVILFAVSAFAVVGFAAWFGFGTPEDAAEYQGWVEGDFLFIGADAAGRLSSLKVKEGQTVEDGAELFSLQSDVEEAEWRQARAALDEAKAKLARAEAAQQRPEEIAVLEAQRARAKAAVEQSGPELGRVEKLFAEGFASASRRDQAKAAFDRDRAALTEIERQIEVARMKARVEDIKAAREVVAQAEARLASANTRRSQRSVLAPATGVIQEVYFRPGEIVPAGRPVVSLLPPKNVKLRFFVPEPALPRISLGDPVSVHCDGCGPDITARVHFLSLDAEFTPPVIFSRRERAKLVYRVEARPDHPERLRVGQPVTITFDGKSVKRTANAVK